MPPDATNTDVVPGWPGRGWADEFWEWETSNTNTNTPPTDRPINTALRAMGVHRGDHPDEATALGLTFPVSPDGAPPAS